MARAGTSNFWGRDGTDNLINQQQMWWRQTCNKEYYKHPFNSLKVVVPQPSYHGLVSTSHEEQAKPWHVMSDASGQQRFPRAGKHSFYYEGGDTTTPIFPYETYTSMRPPREKWGSGEIGRIMAQKDERVVTPVTQRTGRSRSSISIRSERDIKDADFIPDVARDDGSLDPTTEREARGSVRSSARSSARSFRSAARSAPAQARSARSGGVSARSVQSGMSVMSYGSAGPARQAADMAFTQTFPSRGNRADVLTVHKDASAPLLTRRGPPSAAPSSFASRASRPHPVHPGSSGFA